MPPKKQQQQNTSPYIPIYVLPLIANSPQALQSLRKSVSIKKDIDKNKIIEILKDKGLDKFIKENNQISSEGQKFICENLPIVYQQFINQIKKPLDLKKDAKKDTKKDTKKQQIPEQEKQKPIEYDFSKLCSDFFFLFDYPKSRQQLQICLKSNVKIDIILLIQQKVKKGSKPPNYELLNQTRFNQELTKQLQSTQIKPKVNHKLDEDQLKNALAIIQHFTKKQSQISNIQSSIIVQIDYLHDLSHPQKDEMNFLNQVFKKLCELTVDKQAYTNWKNNIKLIPMVQPIAQIVTRQVQIEEKKDQKKGAKKQNKQPQFQTIQQTIYTPYESLPQNQKSNLAQYKRICQLKSKTRNNLKNQDDIGFALQNCIQTAFQKKQNNEFSQEFLLRKLNSLENIPVGKISMQNLKNSIRDICYYKSQYMSYELQNSSILLQNKIKFSQFLQIAPERQQSLRTEYTIQQFQRLMAQKQPKIRWNFSNRHYREKFSKDRFLSQINQELLKNPQIYRGELKSDNLKLFILARINPPGRIIYSNTIFDWKVAPNFQKWQNQFKKNKNLLQKTQFYNYKFQDAGNLSIKSQILMPTDNMIISDTTLTIGNRKIKINDFDKQDKIFGIKKIDQTNKFWLNYKNKINLQVFEKQHLFINKKTIQQINSQGEKQSKQIQTQQKHKRVQTWIRNQTYIISHDPYPKIYWKNHQNEINREFGPKGEVICYLKDGSSKVYYPNGNVSIYRNRKWKKFSNNFFFEDQIQRQANFQFYSQGSKEIRIRQDSTIFVHYQNGDKQVIFQDSTQIYHNSKEKTIQILTKNKDDEIIVRLTHPRDKDYNVIGFGSAFAYLGFQNLIQRSFDGFIYELWTPFVSSHLYIEKYELNNQIYQEEVRLLHFQDETIIKVLGNGTLSYIAGDYNKNRDKLNQNWHQLFTNLQNHKEGVYDIDLRKGSIQTKDSQSNYFKIHVQQKCQVNVAVSFKIGQDQKVQNTFENGFHVPQQNYFLPPPTNEVAPRLFSFDEEGNYYQYLCKEQLKCMREQQYNIQQEKIKDVIIKQYTKSQIGKKQLQDLTFSKRIDVTKFEMPSLLVSKNSRLNMPILNNSRVVHRMIAQIQWSSTFANIIKLQNQINELKKKRSSQTTFFIK